MSDPIELPLDDDDRLTDPPLLDLLREDQVGASYVITFVPSDDLSTDPTLSINVSLHDPEGRRISALLERVAILCGAPVSLISHLGGGNFTLQLVNNRSITLDQLDNNVAVELFDRLKQIAAAAELSYRVSLPIGTLRNLRRRPAV